MLSPMKSPGKSPRKTISSILKDHGVSPTKSPSKARKSLLPVPLFIDAPASPTKSKRSADDKERSGELTEVLGEGPMRFGPPQEQISIKESMRHPSHLEAYIRLKVEIEQNGLVNKFTDIEVLRVARYHNFDVEKIIKLLKRMDPLYWNTSIFQMTPQLQSHSILPLPNEIVSKDKKIQSFFYMNASRLAPMVTSTSALVANLIYVMDTMDRVSSNGSRRKMGFIANMKDWSTESFSSADFMKQFAEVLQGKKGPVHVDLFLLVDPPPAFDKAWQTMSYYFSSSFRNKAHVIKEAELAEYLASGYALYLPNEFGTGELNVPEAVEDFIRFRQHVETNLYPDERKPNKETGSLLRPKRSSSGRQGSLSGSLKGRSLSGSFHSKSCHSMDPPTPALPDASDNSFGNGHGARTMVRNNPNEASLGAM